MTVTRCQDREAAERGGGCCRMRVGAVSSGEEFPARALLSERAALCDAGRAAVGGGLLRDAL